MYFAPSTGVLTKADTLQGRENQIWLPVVKNEQEHLTHGYYVCGRLCECHAT